MSKLFDYSIPFIIICLYHNSLQFYPEYDYSIPYMYIHYIYIYFII